MRSLCTFIVVSALALASTSIGHPVTTGIAPGSGLTFDFAELPVHTMTVDRCDDTTETFEVTEVLDLVAGDTLTLPNGAICGVTLDLGGRLNASGDGTSGGSFSLSLIVGQVSIPVDPPLSVVSGSSAALGVRFADPNWVTATALGLSSGHVHIGPNHAAHDSLRDAVRWDSAILR